MGKVDPLREGAAVRIPVIERLGETDRVGLFEVAVRRYLLDENTGKGLDLLEKARFHDTGREALFRDVGDHELRGEQQLEKEKQFKHFDSSVPWQQREIVTERRL